MADRDVPPHRRRRIIRLLVSAVCVMALAIWAARILPVRDVMHLVTGANPTWIAVALAINIAALLLWMTQWFLLARVARPVPWPRMAGIVALTWSAETALAGLGGGAAILVLMLRGGLTRRSAVALFAVDQLLGGIAKLAILGLAVIVAGLPPWLAHGARPLLLLLTGAALTAAIAGSLWRTRHRMEPWLRCEIAAFMRFLRPATLGPLALSVLRKLSEIGTVLAVQRACGLAASPRDAILIVAATSLATAIPSLPASIGLYEAAVLLVLGAAGVAPAAGLGFALLLHASFVGPALGGGILALALPLLPSRSHLRPRYAPGEPVDP